MHDCCCSMLWCWQICACTHTHTHTRTHTHTHTHTHTQPVSVQVMVFESTAGWKSFCSAMTQANIPLHPQTRILGLDGSRYNMQMGMLESEGHGARTRLPVSCFRGSDLQFGLRPNLNLHRLLKCIDLRVIMPGQMRTPLFAPSAPTVPTNTLDIMCTVV